MSIKLTKHTIVPIYQTVDELEQELLVNLESIKKDFPSFSYKIEKQDNKLIIKSLNLKEYAN